MQTNIDNTMFVFDYEFIVRQNIAFKSKVILSDKLFIKTTQIIDKKRFFYVRRLLIKRLYVKKRRTDVVTNTGESAYF